jgi:thioredoxin-like negative regulator of GroEL
VNGAVALTTLLLLGPGHAVGIRWEKGFDEALKKAQASKRPVLVDFWAEWCGWCHRLDRTTYVEPVVVKLSERFVSVKINTEGSAQETAIAVRYDVNSLPTIAFLSPYGRPILRMNGFQGASQFQGTMERAQEVATRVMAWEATIERDPRDAEALAHLGVHLFEQDAYGESGQLLHRAAQADAKRPLEERKQTRLLLGAILKSDEKFQEAESVLKNGLALAPEEQFDPKLLYVLGKVYVAWGRRELARPPLQKVVSQYPRSPIAQKARETLVSLESN